MSMFNDMDIYKRGNEDTCRTPGHSLDQEVKKSVCVVVITNKMENGTPLPQKW